ncbi:MAG: hypothetical protein GY776_02200 [Alteromonas sp.]|nr:hypothetical protein [Alteromonas sp.]
MALPSIAVVQNIMVRLREGWSQGGLLGATAVTNQAVLLESMLRTLPEADRSDQDKKDALVAAIQGGHTTTARVILLSLAATDRVTFTHQTPDIIQHVHAHMVRLNFVRSEREGYFIRTLQGLPQESKEALYPCINNDDFNIYSIIIHHSLERLRIYQKTLSRPIKRPLRLAHMECVRDVIDCAQHIVDRAVIRARVDAVALEALKIAIKKELTRIYDLRLRAHQEKRDGFPRSGPSAACYEDEEYYHYLTILPDFDDEAKQRLFQNLIVSALKGDLELTAYDLQYINSYCADPTCAKELHDALLHQINRLDGNFDRQGVLLSQALFAYLLPKLYRTTVDRIWDSKSDIVAGAVGILSLIGVVLAKAAPTAVVAPVVAIAHAVGKGVSAAGTDSTATSSHHHGGLDTAADVANDGSASVTHSAQVNSTVSVAEQFSTEAIKESIKNIKLFFGVGRSDVLKKNLVSSIPEAFDRFSLGDYCRELLAALNRQQNPSDNVLKQLKTVPLLLACLLNNYFTTKITHNIDDFSAVASFLTLYAFNRVLEQTKDLGLLKMESITLPARSMRAQVRINGETKFISWPWPTGSTFTMTPKGGTSAAPSFSITIGDPEEPVLDERERCNEAAAWEVDLLNRYLESPGNEAELQGMPGVGVKLNPMSPDVLTSLQDTKRECDGGKIIPLDSQKRYQTTRRIAIQAQEGVQALTARLDKAEQEVGEANDRAGKAEKATAKAQAENTKLKRSVNALFDLFEPLIPAADQDTRDKLAKERKKLNEDNQFSQATPAGKAPEEDRVAAVPTLGGGTSSSSSSDHTVSATTRLRLCGTSAPAVSRESSPEPCF